MRIAFQRRPGDESLGVAFFWKMTIETSSPASIKDSFIPELFFDYFFVREGEIRCVDNVQVRRFILPQQTLKTLYTHPLTFTFSKKLVLYGARLSMKFAESFWQEMQACSFLKQNWVEVNTNDLDSFMEQVKKQIKAHKQRKLPYPLFSEFPQESDWLIHYSPRHKRRLYALIFSLSRKELMGVRNVQSFLEQTCDFASQNPRIIQHVDPEVFYDQPHLNRSFKKMTGFSPLEYFEANSILQDNLMSASYNEDYSQ